MSRTRLVPQLGHTADIRSIDLFRDGSLLLTASLDGTVKLWSVDTGLLLRTFPIGKPAWVAAFDTGTMGGALIPTKDGALERWDLGDDRPPGIFTYPEVGATAIAFSELGKYVLVGSASGTLKYWSNSIVAPGVSRTLPHAHEARITKVSLSKDGLVALSLGDDGRIVLWHVNASDDRRSLEDNGHRGSAALSPDGRLVVSTSGRAWSATTGEPLPGFEPCLNAGGPGLGTAVAFSSCSDEVAFGDFDGTVRRCSVADRKLLASLRIKSMLTVHALAYDRPGTTLFGAYGNGVIAWDLESGGIKRQFARQSYQMAEMWPTKDGRHVLHVDSLGLSGGLWDLQEARRVAIFEGPEEFRHLVKEHGLVLEPDQGKGPRGRAVGTKLELVVEDEGILTLRNRETGELVRRIGAHPLFPQVALARDDRRALSANGGVVRLWDAQKGTLLREFDGDGPIAFSADSSMMVSSGPDSDLYLRTADGEPLRRLSGHTARAWSAAFLSDGRHILTASRDGTMRLWRTDDGSSMCMVSSGGEWLVYTDDGYFDASRGGGGLVATVEGLRAYRIDQTALHGNRPDLLLERMGLGSPDLRAHLRAVHDARIERLGLDPSVIGSSLMEAPRATIVSTFRYGKRVRLECDFSAPSLGLSSYNVYVNGAPLYPDNGVPALGYRHRASVEVELTSGRNRIEVAAFSKDGVESLRALRVESYDRPVSSDLYFLGVGVSRYRDDRLRLQFAHEDALAIGRALERSGALAGKTHIRTLVDHEASVDHILDARGFLERAGVDDTVIVLLSGHGMSSRDAEGLFHFLTYESDPTRLRQTALSLHQIENLLKGIRARRKLILLDACESGERDPGGFASGVKERAELELGPRAAFLVRLDDAAAKPRLFLLDRDRYLYNDLGRRTGAVVFSSSRGSELSYESMAFKHGLFSHEIVLALTTPAADVDGSGAVSLEELRNYVSKQVSTRSRQLQHPTIDHEDPDVQILLPVAPH